MEKTGEEELRRVAKLLTEIEMEAVRLVEGARGASALSIVSRAASARRGLDDLLGQDPVRGPVAASVADGYVRRIRLGVSDLKLSAAAAANLVGLTEEEVSDVMRGEPNDIPLDFLERVAQRLEAEQQLALEPIDRAATLTDAPRPDSGSDQPAAR